MRATLTKPDTGPAYSHAAAKVFITGIGASPGPNGVGKASGCDTMAPAPQAPTALPADENSNLVHGEMIEIMPRLRGGGSKHEVIQYLRRRIVWPCGKGKIVSAEGGVFASFTVVARQ